MIKCKAPIIFADARRLTVMIFVLLATDMSFGQSVTLPVSPDADSFVRSLAPSGNYGIGGALSVSGSVAVNGSGVQNGLIDSLMRWPIANIVATFDATFGAHDWIVTAAQLSVTEMAAPDNDIFDRGIGTFEIRWIAGDQWTEGSGKPMAPTTDGVAWQDLPQILNTNLDATLGIFTNSGANGRLTFSLGLADKFITDLKQGNEVSFYLTASSPEVGFTFNSRNFGNTNAQPVLLLTAAANPRPQIDVITPDGINVSIAFNVVSNWTYRLQYADSLGDSPPANWSNLLTIPAQAFSTNVSCLHEVTNGLRFYRLVVSL